MLKDNVVIKGIGGFYYVLHEGEIIECKGKGAIKNQGILLKVGDRVELSFEDEHTPTISKVLDRKNEFIRPPIANVDGLIIFMALDAPKPNFDLVDKLLIMAESNDLETLIIINKCELDNQEDLSFIKEAYEPYYKVIYTQKLFDEEENEGAIDEIKSFIKDKKVALAGSSGVGKSTLINRLKEDVSVETGNISEKNNRGRHTTRHVEIFTIDNGGMVYDTPGFSSFDIEAVGDILAKDLIKYYIDLEPYAKLCKFKDCSHIKEKDCMLRDAVRTGKVSKKRYLSYKSNYLNMIENEKY
ncbi:MAG: ribosome small subunit-dependent GTPase A [Clostridia bacterium]|nr:ribosome small subunit-dependent GTPase A [Clostridia bacterium]